MLFNLGDIWPYFVLNIAGDDPIIDCAKRNQVKEREDILSIYNMIALPSPPAVYFFAS